MGCKFITGISKAITELPDLILTDLNLPDMIAVEAITILKQIPITSSIPIIVLTAETARRWKTRTLKAGAAEYILKPISARDLLSVVRRFCRPARRVVGTSRCKQHRYLGQSPK